MHIEYYTNYEFDIAFKKILEDTINNYILPLKNPKAYILGGQPGAGKSRLNIFNKELNNKNLVIINGDEYRQYHPHFLELEEKYGIDFPKFTAKFSSQVVEKLIDELSDKKYNLCIEGTLRTTQVPINTCNLLKSKGYYVQLDIMATKKDISYLSTQLRYFKFLSKGMTARATPKEHHDAVFNKIIDNVRYIYDKKVFDNIKIYDRRLNICYDSNTYEISPDKVLKTFYENSYSKYEKENISYLVNELKKLSGKDYSGYLSNIEDKDISYSGQNYISTDCIKINSDDILEI